MRNGICIVDQGLFAGKKLWPGAVLASRVGASSRKRRRFKCRRCGRGFLGETYKIRIYCSNACRLKAGRKAISVQCYGRGIER
jgi:transposase-like protein